MRHVSSIGALGTTILLLTCCAASGQGNAFLYEGALTEMGGPAQGDYDIRFRIYDAPQAGNQVGADVALAPVQVADGRFTVTLDFGAGVFDGGPRWLELGVRSNGVGVAHTVMTPRQRLLPLPYAIHAGSASSVASNGVSAAAIQNATLTADKFASNQVVRSLNGLRDNVELRAGPNITLVTNQNSLVLSAFGGGGGGGDDWHLLGNLGTTAGLNFLGTLDDEPLELKVDNLRALRLQPDEPFECDVLSHTMVMANSPSLVGGFSGNIILDGVAGSVISGGGAFDYPCLGGNLPNVITADMANINGGLGNQVRGSGSTVGGGALNRIEHSANNCVIAGGRLNLISSTGVVASAADNSTISGGIANEIRDDANASTIGGGSRNVIEANINFATIAGGEQNTLGAYHTFIGGGQGHVVQTQANHATIAGGNRNSIGANSSGSTISGGNVNEVAQDALQAVIAGGSGNDVDASADYSAIGGGRFHWIQRSAVGAVIAGGNIHVVGSNATYTVIGGGTGNAIGARAIGAVIDGGSQNAVLADARYGVIGGGDHNVIDDDFGTIAGGGSNQIRPGAAYSAIGGGSANVVETNSHSSVISGGAQNRIAAAAQQSSIGGGANNLIDSLSILSAIGGGSRNIIYRSADHAVIAGGWDNKAASVSTTVSGGYQNSVGINSPWSTVGGGQNNYVTNSQDATISGGARNRVTPGSAAATVSGGEENTASAIAATVPGGRQAHARDWGQQAYAGGRFVQNGDAQTSTFVVRGTTSDPTPRELFLDGTSRRITLPIGATWTFEVLVVARSSDGQSAGYKICGVIECNPTVVPGQGQCVLVGPAEIAFEHEQVAAWNATVEADFDDEALVVRVAGGSGQSIRWVATVHTAEVIY